MFRTENGTLISRIGQGTWYLGEDKRKRSEEISALQAGIEFGINLLDTAEMYGEGAAEELLGEAIKPFDRESLFIVSKVYPWNANKKNIFDSCKNSLTRLGTDYLDLYLLHWKGESDFEEVITLMEELKEKKLIRNWGVSNFDTCDMERLINISGGDACVTDQVLYHVGSRGVEYSLYPWLKRHHMNLMAYCPLAQAGRLRENILENSTLQNIALEHNASVFQIMLAFLLTKSDVIPIPRTGSERHALENARAVEISLADRELNLIDEVFPSPKEKVPLDVE